MGLYLYLDDKFILLPYSFEDVLDGFDRDIYQPYRLIENILKKKLGKILDVKPYASYIDPSKMEFLIEYMVRFENEKSSGKIGVKIIGSKNPARTLIEYYKAEKRGRVKRYT